ncbi:MAG TPA: SIS domain-containing protein [Chloroflexaceae bacterium]|nr:SIS domain-containing protein [Chloroflexaceae bacterium]
MEAGSHTRAEIASQPETWRLTLEALAAVEERAAETVDAAAGGAWALTGCGSTYYLALASAAVMRRRGLPARAAPASELALFPGDALSRAGALVAFSRSGTTTETLWAVDRYRQLRPDGKVLVVTCAPGTPLASRASLALIAAHAQEQSVAQTRSFTSMGLMGQALAAWATGDPGALQALAQLPGALESLVAREGELPRRMAADPGLERCFFLGGGPLYGLACEAMLKTKELGRAWAEAYHPLELRHGPMALVDSGALVVGLISDSAAEHEVAVLRHMKSLGARTVALAEGRGELDWSGVDHVAELRSGLDEWTRGMLYLPLIQSFALEWALARGYDPDRPANLPQVIILE